MIVSQFQQVEHIYAIEAHLYGFFCKKLQVCNIVVVTLHVRKTERFAI